MYAWRTPKPLSSSSITTSFLVLEFNGEPHILTEQGGAVSPTKISSDATFFGQELDFVILIFIFVCPFFLSTDLMFTQSISRSCDEFAAMLMPGCAYIHKNQRHHYNVNILQIQLYTRVCLSCSTFTSLKKDFKLSIDSSKFP